jgi:hypothetical protein
MSSVIEISVLEVGLIASKSDFFFMFALFVCANWEGHCDWLFA